MSSLQDLLTGLGLASLSEINEAIFSHPNLGLVEALSRTLGQVREEEILNKISQVLGFALIEDEIIDVDENVIEDGGTEVKSLISTHKALPLCWFEREGKNTLKLAMADPANEEAIEAFAELFGAPITVCIARERTIENALASCGKGLNISDQDLMDSDSRSAVEADRLSAEDPEVGKAIQQIVATAVKHSAEKVIVAMDNLFTRAVFTFEDSAASSVDISVSTSSFLSGLLMRGQIVSRSRNSFEAACRVEFKSSAVFFSLEVHCDPSEHIDEDAGVSSGAIEWKSIVLNDFSLDSPDDPNFWLSVPEKSSLAIRRVFREQSGMFFLVSRDEKSRVHAIRALVQSYPDLHVVEKLNDLAEKGELFKQAKAARVLVGSESATVFAALKSLLRLPREYRKLVRGVVSYCHLPRICECCAERISLSSSDQALIPDYIDLDQGRFRKGSGCKICAEQGFVGSVGACSVFDIGSRAGGRFVSGASMSEIQTALAEGDFESLWENGLMAVICGRTSVDNVVRLIPKRVETYESARGKSTRKLSIPVQVISEEDAPLFSDSTGSGLESQHGKTNIKSPEIDTSSSGLSPVTGRAVFSSQPTYDEGRSEESLDLSLRELTSDESISEVGVVRKSAEKPLLLVIDDDPDQRAILHRVLELEGYAVQCAADGIDGIVSANRLSPNLIIVDFMMPDLDGRETVRRLKNDKGTSAIPVMALTAYPDPDVEYSLLKAGADDFCSKAVSKKVLLKRIERLLPE